MKKALIISLILLLFPFTLIAEICGYKESCSVTFFRDGKKINSFNAGTAKTDETRARGLMFCNSMEREEGLLFIFDYSGPKSFWMKNTLIPLDIVFISDDLKVLSVHKGVPFSLEHITEKGDVKYVLEVNMGEASEIKSFDRVKIDMGL